MSSKSPKINVYKLMAASPLLLLVFIAVQVRTFSDPFQPVGFTMLGQKRILAYRNLVEETENHIQTPKHKPSEIRVLADKWIAARKSGELEPIYAAASADSMQEGIRGEILATALRFNQRLTLTADRARASGNLEEAKVFYLRSLQFDEILKYSDLLSLNIFRVEQTRTLRKLNALRIESPSSKQDISSQLKALLADQRSLEHLERVDRLEYMQGQANLEAANLTDTPQTSDNLRPANRIIVARGVESAISTHSSFQFGFQSQEGFKSLLSQSVRRWAGTPIAMPSRPVQ